MTNLVPYDGRGLPQQRQPGYEQYPPPEQFTEVEPSASISDYLAIIRRQWWVVLSIAAIAVGISFYVVLSAPPRYRAVSVIRLADTRRAVAGDAAAGAYEQVLSRETDVLQSQIQVLSSRGVVGDVVDSLGLRLLPMAKQPWIRELTQVRVSQDAAADTVRFDFRAGDYVVRIGNKEEHAGYGLPVTIADVSFVVTARPRIASSVYSVVDRNSAISWVQDAIRAAPRPKTDIVDVSFESGDPVISQRVANTLSLTFRARNQSGAQKTSRTRRIFLEEQMKQTDAMLQTAMNNYSSFRSGQKVFSSREKGSAEQAGLVTVDMRRAELDAERRTYQSLLSQAQRAQRGGDVDMRALVSAPGIAANPVIQSLYGQLAGYENMRDSLVTAGAAATNPDLQAINTMLSSTSERLVGAVRNQIQGLTANIESLDQLRARSQAQIAYAPQTETEEAQLGQQVQTMQKLSDQLQEEYQKARMAEAVEAGQVEIVDRAEVPTQAMSAGRSRKIALGLVIGLILGVGAAIVIDGMNKSIRRRDDLEKILQVPGLAVIPKFVSSTPNAGLLSGKSLKKKSNGASSKNGTSSLVTIADARSTGAEAFRTLRTNLIFSQAVSTLRTIVVTSAAPSEGKTTTAANLAVTFAQQGMRVLVVDCDLRRATLHKAFKISREPGLTELLLDHAELETVARDTVTPGLYVLPAGKLPPNPAELLGGDRMRKTLAMLSGAYDLVVLDTPPLLAASDAAILATLTDGVILVVRAGRTETEAGQQAIAQLNAVGARIVGAVLNDPDSKLASYGGYYSYSYAESGR